MENKEIEESKIQIIEIINQIEDDNILIWLLKVVKNIHKYPPFPEVPKEFLKDEI